MRYIIVIFIVFCFSNCYSQKPNEEIKLYLMINKIDNDSVMKKFLNNNNIGNVCYNIDSTTCKLSLSYSLFLLPKNKNYYINLLIDTTDLTDFDILKNLFEIEKHRNENEKQISVFKTKKIETVNCKIILNFHYAKVTDEFYLIFLNSDQLKYDCMKAICIFNNKNEVIYFNLVTGTS